MNKDYHNHIGGVHDSHYGFHQNHSDKFHHIEKVQHEIMQQHKYLETQLNQLKDSIKNVCSTNDCDVYKHHVGHRTQSLYPVLNDVVFHHRHHYNDNYKIRKF
nr:unknown [Darna trima granulovirus]